MSRKAWILMGVVVIVLVFALVFAMNQLGTIPTTAATPTPTAFPCPLATPELLTVEPVTSPTAERTQTIRVTLGNGEEITVETASGTFTAAATFPMTEVTIDLLPNTTHELTVIGKVAEIQQGDCTYGGYTLSTRVDRYGDPLMIVTE